MAKVPDPLPYGGHQARGRRIQDWLNDPTIPDCHITGAGALTYQAIDNWIPVTETYILPDVESQREISDIADQNNINGPWVHHMLMAFEMSSSVPPRPINLNSFESFTAPGWMFLMSIFRHDGPQWSQIAQVMYERVSPIATLRHIVVTDIQNDDTKDLILDQIYGIRNRLMRLSPLQDRTFAYGSAEYEAVLGTRLGSVVSYIILGGLPRGTRRISQISVSFPRGGIGGMQLQFDIQVLTPVPAAPPAYAPPPPYAPPPYNGSGNGGDPSRAGSGGGKGGNGGPANPRKRVRNTTVESYDGPARRTRMAMATEGRIRKPYYFG